MGSYPKQFPDLILEFVKLHLIMFVGIYTYFPHLTSEGMEIQWCSGAGLSQVGGLGGLKPSIIWQIR